MRGPGAGRGFWQLLSDGDRAALSALGRSRTFAPSASICGEGEPATHVFVLVAGWVKVLSDTGGREQLLALRGQGELVGELAGETDGYRVATLRAVGHVRALIVSHDRFSAFLGSHPDADHAYHRVLAMRLSDTDAELRRRSTTSGAQRLAGVLLHLATHFGVAAAGGTEITAHLSQGELASLAGTSRATVIRALTDWRRRGIIRTGQRYIAIADEVRLQRLTGELPAGAGDVRLGSPVKTMMFIQAGILASLTVARTWT
jgi:CRP/FNR family transcriptional regulator, cyclic AMP receptor protein